MEVTTYDSINRGYDSNWRDINQTMTTPASSAPKPITDEFIYFVLVFILLAIVISVVGNSLTVVIICSSSRLRTPSNAFIVHLSISDMLYMIAILPVRFAAFYHHAWPWGATACNLLGSASHTFYGASNYTMALIAICRVVHVVHTHHYKQLYSPKSVALQLTALWFFILILAFILPASGLWGWYEYTSSVFSCTFSQDNQVYKYVLITVGVWVPCVLIIPCYTRIYIHVRRNQKRMEAWAEAQCQEARERTNSFLSSPVVPQESATRYNRVAPLKEDPNDVLGQRRTVAPPILDRYTHIPVRTLYEGLGDSEDITVHIDRTSPHHSTQPRRCSTPTTSNELPKRSHKTRTMSLSANFRPHVTFTDEPSNVKLNTTQWPAGILKNPNGRVAPQEGAPSSLMHQEEGLVRNRSQSLPQIPEMSSADNNSGTQPELSPSMESVFYINFPKQRPRTMSTTSHKSVSFSNTTTMLDSLRETNENQSSPSPAPSRAESTRSSRSESFQDDSYLLMRKHRLIQKHRRDAVKLSAMMLCIFIIYLICNMPYYISNMVPRDSLFAQTYVGSLVLTWVSPCLNPVIYALMNSQFQTAYREMIGNAFNCHWWKQT